MTLSPLPTTDRPHLLDSFARDLPQWLTAERHPKFRAGQIQKWLFSQRAGDWEQMTDLPKQLRQRLADSFVLWTTQIATHTQSEDGTEKLLLTLRDGGQIECVLLRDDADRRTICISTQVGCAMGCVFCASGLGGVERNLTTGEIVEQMLLLQSLLPPEERLSHIVVMGMGEPLANIDQLLPALQLANDESGLGIGARRITISTVGIPPAMRRLANENARFRLAVSLHAPNDALRNQLVKINAQTGLTDILAEADHYFSVSGRQLTFEYVLLSGVNDSPDLARELAQLLRGREAIVNIIPYNPVAGLPYQTPPLAAQREFRQLLEDGGLTVRMRHRKGDRINAACGQLRRNVASQPAR